MTQNEAIKILQRIQCNPSIADQFTEDEIEQIEQIAREKKA